MKNKEKTLKVLRWIARIGTVPISAFVLFMIGAHLFSGNPNESLVDAAMYEVVQIALFLVVPVAGLILAWFWEGVGGALTVASLIGFATMRPDLVLDPWMTALYVPAFLFIIYSIAMKKLKNSTSISD